MKKQYFITHAVVFFLFLLSFNGCENNFEEGGNE